MLADVPWEAIGAIGTAAGVVVTALSVRWSRARARLTVLAYRDVTGHVKTVVDNTKGTEGVDVRLVTVVGSDRKTEVWTKSSFRGPLRIEAGGSKDWWFDVPRKQKRVRVRVDTGGNSYFKKPERTTGVLIESGEDAAN